METTTKRLFRPNAAGGVDYELPFAGESDEAYTARVRAFYRDAQFSEVEVSAMPDTYFRGAWQATLGKLTVDMAKAREIHRDNLRRQRVARLAALDIEYTKAEAAGNILLKGIIEKKRQALRDVPADPRIEAANTPEALKAVIPAALLE